MRVTTKRVLISLWLAGLIAPFLWLVRLLLGDPAPVAVSKETTFLTGEQLEDGTLDFSRALATHCNATIPDSQNAAAALRMMNLPTSLQSYRNSQNGNLKPWGVKEWKIARSAVHETLSGPWTRDKYPVFATMVDRERDDISRWKNAIQRPRLVKPPNVTLQHLTDQIVNGSEMVIRRANLDVAEGRMSDAVRNLRSADRAAELLSGLQCGWEIETACRIRTNVSDGLRKIVLSVKHVDPVLSDFIRERATWSVADATTHAVDQAIRIRFQLAVRDFRNKPGYLKSMVQHTFVGSDQRVRDLQFNRIRNGINWSHVARTQNNDINAFLMLWQQDKPGWLVECRDFLDELQSRGNAVGLENTGRLNMGSLTTRIGNLLSAWSQVKFFDPLISLRNRLQGTTRSAQVALELALYREANGDFPAAIDSLSKKVRQTVFRAPVSGNSLTYKKDRAGFVVQKDNGQLFFWLDDDEARKDLF